MLTVVERMDEEFTKMLQACDAHSTEYIERFVKHGCHFAGIILFCCFSIGYCNCDRLFIRAPLNHLGVILITNTFVWVYVNGKVINFS